MKKTYIEDRERTIEYPLAKSTIAHDEVDKLVEWLKTYPRLTKDVLTLEFEKKWAEFIGTKYAVFCNSGSSANLMMAYATQMTFQKKPFGVIVPSVAWITTISPFIQLGFEPCMVDADKHTYGIDLDQLEALCKEYPALIKSVIFVQVLGIPHYKDRLLELKDTYGFMLLEDGCAALGAEYADGSKVGTVGDMSSFSFYFGHQLSTIEGGMVNTNDEELYHNLLMIRSHGWGKDLPSNVYEQKMKQYNIDSFHQPFTFFEPGFNLRATDLQAFLGLEQLKKAEWVVQRRNQNHLVYASLLKDKFSFQDWGNDKPVSISFGCLAKSTEQRYKIVQALKDNGIETRIFSAGNLGKHPFWIDRYGEFNGVVANQIHSNGFFLPNYPELTEEDIKFICDVVVKAGE